MIPEMDDLLEIKLAEPDDFLVVKETLTRIGVPSKDESVLFQSCHILHKRGRYFIVHFKELFALDGKESNFGEEDLARRNTIANLLVSWNLVSTVRPIMPPFAPTSTVKVIPHRDKAQWRLEAKYSIGKRATR